jgi:hypothetical protein
MAVICTVLACYLVNSVALLTLTVHRRSTILATVVDLQSGCTSGIRVTLVATIVFTGVGFAMAPDEPEFALPNPAPSETSGEIP